MSKVEAFLTAQQEAEVVLAITNAEKNTSGEIRVHLERSTELPPVERALEVFHLLKMNETELKNGILIYVAVESRKLAILGDSGINEKVPKNFWEEEKNLAIENFKNGDYTKGLCLVVEQIGEKLKEFFPYQKNDTNELPNDISKG